MIGGLDVFVLFCEGFLFIVYVMGFENFDVVENGEMNFEVGLVYLLQGSMDDFYMEGVFLGQFVFVGGIVEFFEIGD